MLDCIFYFNMPAGRPSPVNGYMSPIGLSG